MQSCFTAPRNQAVSLCCQLKWAADSSVTRKSCQTITGWLISRTSCSTVAGLSSFIKVHPRCCSTFVSHLFLLPKKYLLIITHLLKIIQTNIAKWNRLYNQHQSCVLYACALHTNLQDHLFVHILSCQIMCGSRISLFYKRTPWSASFLLWEM